jgi:hypothetical protein
LQRKLAGPAKVGYAANRQLARGYHLEFQRDWPPDDFDAEAEDRRFEMLLIELSARFVSVTFESINDEIVDAQRRIVQALNLDRSTLAQLEDGERFVLTHAWHLPGLEPFPSFAIKDLPWLTLLFVSFAFCKKR